MSAAIFYLVRKSDKDLLDLERNISLVKSIEHLKDLPILVLSEEELPPIQHAKFHKIEFAIPPYVNQNNMMTKFGEKHTVGYLHMCDFYSGRMFKEDCLKPYDILIRLDTDGFLSHMEQNLPEIMRKQKIPYMYSGRFIDSPIFTQGLKETTEQYCKGNNLPSSFLNLWNLDAFNTNFEILNMAELRKTKYIDMYEFFAKTGGFYHYRWGDCPFRLLAMNALGIKHELMNGIEYRHQEFVRRMSN